MTTFAFLIDALDDSTHITRTAEHEKSLRELHEKLEKLADVLLSNEFPCPICYRTNVPAEQRGIITLSWDHETDDMGYKVSSWPVFSSTCEDVERVPYTVRGSRIANSWDRGRFPRNHGEQLNHAIEDGDTATEVDYTLGAAQERRRIRELLVIGEMRGSWFD